MVVVLDGEIADRARHPARAAHLLSNARKLVGPRHGAVDSLHRGNDGLRHPQSGEDHVGVRVAPPREPGRRTRPMRHPRRWDCNHHRVLVDHEGLLQLPKPVGVLEVDPRRDDRQEVALAPRQPVLDGALVVDQPGPVDESPLRGDLRLARRQELRDLSAVPDDGVCLNRVAPGLHERRELCPVSLRRPVDRQDDRVRYARCVLVDRLDARSRDLEVLLVNRDQDIQHVPAPLVPVSSCLRGQPSHPLSPSSGDGSGVRTTLGTRGPPGVRP